MVVICDTSPLSALLRVGQLDILRHLFSKIFIPNAVYVELLELKSFGYDIKPIVSPSEWIEIPLPGHVNDLEVKALKKFLDYGEAEVIAWAKEFFDKSVLLVIDEKKARRTAEEAGFNVIGLVGLLVKAKMEGIILDVKPLLDQIVTTTNFRISKQIYRRTLDEAGE